MFSKYKLIFIISHDSKCRSAYKTSVIKLNDHDFTLICSYRDKHSRTVNVSFCEGSFLGVFASTWIRTKIFLAPSV